MAVPYTICRKLFALVIVILFMATTLSQLTGHNFVCVCAIQGRENKTNLFPPSLSHPHTPHLSSCQLPMTIKAANAKLRWVVCEHTSTEGSFMAGCKYKYKKTIYTNTHRAQSLQKRDNLQIEARVVTWIVSLYKFRL